MSAARPPAFDDLLAPLVGRGYALALTMLNDRAAAEDAVQEAAIKAWRKLPALRDRMRRRRGRDRDAAPPEGKAAEQERHLARG